MTTISPPVAVAEEDDIREAVFRYQFEHNGSGQQQSAEVYFIGITDGSEKSKDPTDSFLARFSDVKPPVRKRSRAFSSDSIPTDRVTGETGLIFRTSEIRRVSESEVEVDGGYYEANLSSSWNTYSVEKKNGKWMVVKDVMHWIS